MSERHRIPYVGDGIDGALRSADIDRSEIDTLPTGPHQHGWTPATELRRDELLDSIIRWESQAAILVADEAAALAEDAARPDPS